MLRRRNIFFITAFLLFCSGNIFHTTAFAKAEQTPAVIDSLKSIAIGSKADSVLFDTYYQLAIAYQANDNNDSALVYTKNALICAQKIADKRKQADVLLLQGKIEITSFGPRDAPTMHLLKSLDIYTQLKDSIGIANSNLQLGILGFEMRNYPDAVEYFLTTIQYSKEEDRLFGIAQYLLALSYSELGDFDKAKDMFEIARLHYGKDYPDRIMQINSFIGKMYINSGDYDTAIQHLNDIIRTHPELENDNALAPTYAFLSSAYLLSGDFANAIKSGNKAVELCQNNGAFSIYLKEAQESLYKAYEHTGNFKMAYYHLNNLNTLKDSISGSIILQRIAEMKGKYTFEQQLNQEKAEQELKNALAIQELRRQKQFSYLLGFGLFLVLLFAILFLRQRIRIAKEKKRSDELLLNILPEETAEELKMKGSSEAKSFQQVSVLFTDFKDFTQLSEKLSATQLVEEIHGCFSAFDNIIEKYDIEKIKTIGDSYMAAAGLPIPIENSAKTAVLAALDMCDYIEEHKNNPVLKDYKPLEMRCGVHTGPVVAGIVGIKKFQFDIWGDTVNTASRMESNGEVGRVNISQYTYEQIKNDPDFIFEKRGMITVKGKGSFQMYFVDRRKVSVE